MSDSKHEQFLKLREKYPSFIYADYRIAESDDLLCLDFHFIIPGLAEFRPHWDIAKLSPYCGDITDRRLDELVFSLGMVELASYWKTTCSPQVSVNCGAMSDTQVAWWKKLYKKGLGEFFYTNGIDVDDDFMSIVGEGGLTENLGFRHSERSEAIQKTQRSRDDWIATVAALPRNDEGFRGTLIPIGGGKDSAVTLELLKGCAERFCYIINPRKATLDTVAAAGIPSGNLIVATRTLDENMLALNKRGFLNGHTPFSTIVAFSSVIAAYVHGIEFVALSNESSADEATVPDCDVNHQYSKSLEFETDFIDYEAKHISSGVKYFSLLRPLTEIGIAGIFSRFKQYHQVFRSCNAGSKEDIWCAACPKCLFVYIILSPFMAGEEMIGIFGKNMLDDAGLIPIFDKLIGAVPEKPFECVGSRDEVNAVMRELVRRYESSGAAMPELVGYYKELSARLGIEKSPDFASLRDSYDEKNHVPELFAQAVLGGLSHSAESSAHPRHCEPGEAIQNPQRRNTQTMTQLLSNIVRGKRVLLLGFGMEGQSTYKLLKEIGTFSEIGIADINRLEVPPDCAAHFGENYLDHISDYDIAFKSPGIVLPKRRSEYSIPITSQTEVFLRSYRKQVIGITGTKGKSTVSSLLAHVLSSSGVPCVLAGNIGKPVFDIVPDIAAETIVVLELSCHQLEYCDYSPATAVLLNIFEDHLDHYGTFEKYVKAKKNIYLHQQTADLLYCARSVKPARSEAFSRVIVINSNILPFDSPEEVCGAKLPGKHNLDNCAFVYSIASRYGVTDEGFGAALKSFAPLRHRLEFIGAKDGVDYYDDSISTTAQSTICATQSIRNASTVLVGGMDRGIDYAGLAEHLAASELSNVICMYESGKRIFDLLERHAGVKPMVTYCKNLAEAAKTAQAVTPQGGACILSPASASYGDFKNFEERGDAFRGMIFGT